MTQLNIADLVLRHNSGGYDVTPVNGLSFDVADGELTLLLGASGCGKTTLLSALASLHRPAAGSITLDDVDVTTLHGPSLGEYRRHTVGMVFQAFNLLPSLSALDNVAVALWNAGYSGRAGRTKAAALLDGLGLGARQHHHPAQLSGGEAQRVAIARALALEPRLLLADEPTAHLDHVQVDRVLSLLRDLARPGRIVVVATHDDRLLPLADRVVELSAHTLAGPTEPIRESLVTGEVLFHEGDEGDRVYVVESGEIRLSRRTTDGRDETLAVHGPHAYFGELAPLFGTRRSASAIAMTDAVVVGYGVAEFRRLGGARQLAERLVGS